MKLIINPVLCSLYMLLNLSFAQAIGSTLYATNFKKPLFICPHPTIENIMFVMEQGGLIWKIKNNPNSRRLLMTDYNHLLVSYGVLYPCHSLILQFFKSLILSVNIRFLFFAIFKLSVEISNVLSIERFNSLILFELISKPWTLYFLEKAIATGSPT